MILVITPEKEVPYETDCINQLFQEGLDLLHIRKPGISRKEMIGFISKIEPSFYHQLVFHNHYDLGENYGISRFHFREADRQDENCQSFMKGNIISTSVHDIPTYNGLGEEWQYAFLSPFFPSISKKGYGEDSTVMEEVKQRNNSGVKLIALGGIHSDNIQKVFDAGVDGAALLGAIWENNEPINIFRKCRKSVLL